MKERIFLFIAGLFTASACILAGNLANSGSCGKTASDNVYWSYDATSQALIISGSGQMADYSELSPAPWASLSYKSITVTGGVTSIGAYAFYNHPVNTVSLGNDIEEIKIKAFYVKYAEMAEKASTYTSLYLPKRLKRIEQTAFFGQKNITTLFNTDSIEYVGPNCFQDCSGLRQVSLPACEEIGQGAFMFASALQSVTLGTHLKKLDSYAFQSCASLSQIILPSYVSLTLGNSIVSGEVLRNMTVYVNYGYKESMSGLEQSNLEEANLIASLTDNIVCSLDGNQALTVSSAEGSAVTSLPEAEANSNLPWKAYASQAKALEVKDFTSIGSYDFYGMNRLQSVRLNARITKIGEYAFGGCTGMSGLILGERLERIESHAFDGCTGLENNGIITSWATTPPTCTGQSFSGIRRNLVRLDVPSGAENAYRNATEWSLFYASGSAVKSVQTDPFARTGKRLIDGRVVITLPDGTDYDAGGRLIR